MRFWKARNKKRWEKILNVAECSGCHKQMPPQMGLRLERFFFCTICLRDGTFEKVLTKERWKKLWK